MSNKKMIKAGILAASLFLAIPFGSVVHAETNSLYEAYTEKKTAEDHAEDTAYSLLRGNNLGFGNASVTKLSSNEINVFGLTQCHHACQTVYLSLYLERKINGNYATYKSWDFTTSNATKLTKSLNVWVPRGYYYRVRGYHAAKDGTRESTSTLTSGIWMN
ncbi:MAG: DUF6147 family protein [Eubacteriales bacterium]|nr:DUF6147 family protein [Eubacteriales bacterium]